MSRGSRRRPQILKDLNKLGITNIPTLVDDGIVQVDAVDDSTQNIRNAINDSAKTLPESQKPRVVLVGAHDELKDSKKEPKQADAKNKAPAPAAAAEPPAAKAKKPKPQKAKRVLKTYFVREHHRLLLWPFGRPLTDFRCLEELFAWNQRYYWRQVPDDRSEC